MNQAINFYTEWSTRADSLTEIEMSGRTTSEENIDRMRVDLASKLDLAPQDTLLDLGCGPGLFVRAFRPHVRSAIGLDYVLEILKRGRAKDPSDVHIPRVVGDARSLPFVDDAFSKVLCYEVFQFLGDMDTTAVVLREILRVCLPDGVAIIGGLLDRRRLRAYLSHRRSLQAQADPGLFAAIRRMAYPFVRWTLRVLGRETSLLWHEQMLWHDPDRLVETVRQLGAEAKALPQDESLPGAHYRFDLRVEVRKPLMRP